MRNAIVICCAADIPRALLVARDLPSYVCYLFDPVLVDQAADAGLHHIEYLRWESCPPYHELEARAHAAATAFEQRLDAALRDTLPALSLAGWQHLNLYYLHMSYYWYTGLWQAMEETLRGQQVHVLVCDNPAHNYAPSFLPALLLLQQLRAGGHPFTAATYQLPTDPYHLVPDLASGLPPGVRGDVLTHLPTCFYDLNYFNAELRASGLRCLNLRAKYWGVPVVNHHDIGLIPLDAAPDTRPGVALQATLEAALDTLLAPLVGTATFRARQAAHLAMLYRGQVICHDLLQQALRSHAPARLLLSDHDAGFHGPLLAYAGAHDIPVLMVPHAKTSGSTDFSYRHLTMLTHPLQATPLLDGNGRQVQHRTLCYPELQSADTGLRPLKKIGLLLNGIALNGVLCSEFSVYLDGIGQMHRWCKAHGVELVIRSRPVQSLVRLLHDAIGADPAALQAALACSLQEFVAEIDLCLMYDAPTSAGIEVLRVGVPLLNPIPSPLGKAEGLGADTRLVPRAGIEATLAMLDDFSADPTVLHQFARQQFAGYAARFGDSTPLRRFL
ncbi:MAG TPA: hypothetical protein VFT05_15765 [Burkholderiaceae bacterium]|nr:hypothetical protein [Burkholderiaceae bacterium]